MININNLLKANSYYGQIKIANVRIIKKERNTMHLSKETIRVNGLVVNHIDGVIHSIIFDTEEGIKGFMIAHINKPLVLKQLDLHKEYLREEEVEVFKQEINDSRDVQEQAKILIDIFELVNQKRVCEAYIRNNYDTLKAEFLKTHLEESLKINGSKTKVNKI